MFCEFNTVCDCSIRVVDCSTRVFRFEPLQINAKCLNTLDQFLETPETPPDMHVLYVNNSTSFFHHVLFCVSFNRKSTYQQHLEQL